ncbi:MAG: PhzF family phenazine biosynthesis protein [Bryobacterales bacterium]|nr:PhzF family phenazine biosynthesis protein [Bryobacterales bacterium]
MVWSHNRNMLLPLYQVDAFTSRRFAGNPAAIVPLGAWLEDAALQAIALENNLAETAFFVPRADGFHLRWFTPLAEVDLCGHATLASAWVLFHLLNFPEPVIRFHTLSGELRVSREGQRLRMDFPATPARPAVVKRDLVRAMGAQPLTVLESRDIVFVYDDADQVKRLQPDIHALMRLVPFGLIATAPGVTSGEESCDFVSRFFAPAMGVPEDPVTGSAHCTLTPYWAERTGKTSLFARQVSSRGGELWCSLHGDRVHLEGEAVLYMRGEIEV